MDASSSLSFELFQEKSGNSSVDFSKPVALVFGYDNDVRYLLKTFLGLWKCEAVEIQNEIELADFAKVFSPHLILFDLSKDFTGDIDVLRRMRKSDLFKDTPVFVFSGYTRPENYRTAFEFGATEYFSKPVDFELLKSTVGNYLHC